MSVTLGWISYLVYHHAHGRLWKSWRSVWNNLIPHLQKSAGRVRRWWSYFWYIDINCFTLVLIYRCSQTNGLSILFISFSVLKWLRIYIREYWLKEWYDEESYLDELQKKIYVYMKKALKGICKSKDFSHLRQDLVDK